MNMNTHHLYRVLACVACVGMVAAGCAGCGSSGGSSHSQSNSAGSSDSSSSSGNKAAGGAKIAPTLKDYVQSLLDSDSDSMSAQQKTALERAVQNDGKVSQSDYERAWSDYKQCIVDKGYSAPELYKYSSGVYALPTYDTPGGTASEQQKSSKRLNEDLSACSMLHITDISTVYKLQIGNPGLSTDTSAVAVDCLRRENVKPKSYTAEQLDKDLASSEGGLTDNAKALNCLVVSGINAAPSNAPVWHPFE